MAAVHEGKSLTDLFEIRDNERLLELAFYDSAGTLYKGRESGALSVLNKLRLEGEAGFCDVILEVEGRQLTTHRCILAANSPFFYTMFSIGMKDSNQTVYSLQSVCFTSMSLILDYFYTREIVINDENVLDLLNASSFLLVTPVKNACSEHLSKGLSTDNCFSVLQVAEQFGADELTEKANNYIKANFSTLVNNEEFVSISQKQLVRLISSDDLLVETEEEIYQSVLTWVKHDEANRVAVLPELLKHLRKDSLPKGFLESEMEREPLLMATRSDGAAAPSKRGKNEKSVLERRPSTETHDVLIGFESRGTGKAFLYDLDKKEMVLLTDESEFKFDQQLAVVGRTLFLMMGGNIGGSIYPRLRAVCFDNLKNPSSSEDEDRKLEFESKAPFRMIRADASLVSLNGLLYYIGGCEIALGICYNTVECYNPDTDDWSFCAGLNMARCGSGCVASEQNIYVIGGANQRVLLTVEKYDPEINSWSYVAPLKVARSSPRCVFVADKIYAIGGIDSNGLRISSCEVYSMTTWINEWQTIAQLLSPDCQINDKVIIVEDQISVPSSPWQFSNEALQYTAQSNSWMKLVNFFPSGKEGSFTVCTMKLPVFILQRILSIAGEFCQENWNHIETDEEDLEPSDIEWSSDSDLSGDLNL